MLTTYFPTQAKTLGIRTNLNGRLDRSVLGSDFPHRWCGRACDNLRLGAAAHSAGTSAGVMNT